MKITPKTEHGGSYWSQCLYFFTPMIHLIQHLKVKWENKGGMRYWHLWHLHSLSCCPVDVSEKATWLRRRRHIDLLYTGIYHSGNYKFSLVCRPAPWQKAFIIFHPSWGTIFCCCVIFQNTDSKPAINKKRNSGNDNSAINSLNCTSWRNASVPIALLILAQISIACKELLTSLKQAILIKARIINSDLRTPWPLKMQREVWLQAKR